MTDSFAEDDAKIEPVPNLLGLKILVVGLGVLLVVAAITFVILLVTVGPKSARDAKAIAAAQAAEMIDVHAEEVAVKEIIMPIEAGMEITGSSISGDRLVVQTKTDSGAEVLVFDIKSGILLSRITFE